MERSAVAADEQGGARDKAAQLGQRELLTRQHRVAQSLIDTGDTQPLTGPISNLTGCFHLGRTGREDDTTNRVRRAKLNCERLEVSCRPSPERIPGADVYHN
jgi:hypothetical protein